MWCFFDEIDDVPTLTAIEEQGEAWEALLDGDRLGMAVVDTVEKGLPRLSLFFGGGQIWDIVYLVEEAPHGVWRGP